jgi:hypothetical protein
VERSDEAERIKMVLSQDNKQVIAAIHKVQQAIDIIKREETADTGKYKYNYASLSKIWLQVKPELEKNELTVMQPPVFESIDSLETWIHHSSGEYAMTKMRLIITREDPQGMGSAISYARRYALLATLGIVTDDDNDATTQRLADGEMKRDWVRAYTVVSKKTNPDHIPTNMEFIKFMTEVYGKHPSSVLAKEHQTVLDTINAFDTAA